MSESPWYRRFPDNFIAGTVGLTLEEKGAYSLVLDLIYVRGGPVPDEPRYIAGICNCSVRKWNAIRNRLIDLGKIEARDGLITNHRAEKEIEKAAKTARERAESGAKGGNKSAENRADTNENNNIGQAKLDHTRAFQEARDKKEKIEPKAQCSTTPRAAPEPSVYDRLIAAASIRGPCHERLAFGFSPIADLIAKGYDLDRDILPVIRDRAGPERRSWDYFVPIIIEAAAKRAAVPEAPRAPEFDWRRALEVFREGTWAAGWGPKPGERGCRVPMPLLAEFGFERAA